MYKLSNISMPYIKETPNGYAIYADLDNASSIMLDWYFSDKSAALKSMNYIMNNVLEKQGQDN